MMTTILPTATAEAGGSSAAVVSFAPVSYGAVPGWDADNHAAAFAALRTSCPAVIARNASADATLSRLSLEGQRMVCLDPGFSRVLSQNRVGHFCERCLAEVCRHAISRGSGRIGRTEARHFFERFFVPHRVAHQGPAGLLTGYYEPHIRGSRTQTARFRVPIYKRPPDLENVVAESQRATSSVPYTHMRRTTAGLEPYATRAAIEAGVLAGKGLELVWVGDPVDAFFAQVQGSALIVLPDGSRMPITYDGKNGHPYTSIGRVLIDRGAISAEAMSLARLGAWLRADEARGREVMRANASFAFFREMGTNEGGAQGALGVPLKTGRSLAVDTAFHALGTPVFVDAPRLTHWGGANKPFRRLMIAQDVGSAIRGPERGDIYFGSGDRAGAWAGITRHPGSFYVLLPRSGARQP